MSVSKNNNMNKDKAIAKKEELDKRIANTRDLFASKTDHSHDRSLIKEFLSLLDKKKPTKSETKRKDELMNKLGMIHGLQNGIWVANVSYEKYNSSLFKMREDVVKTYSCNTPMELMLADRIVASYWRSMRCDSMLNRLIEKEDGGYTYNDQTMRIIRELGKNLESANRLLNMNMILLKEMKQPKLDVRVKANTAFIAQNQQVNADGSYKANNETNDSK